MATIESPRVFGPLMEGADYVLRPGGYAVIRRATGEIAVVTTPSGCYLPGGGQNEGEPPDQAAIRETREECGLQIRIAAPIGVADQLVSSADRATSFRKRCSFFVAEVIASGSLGGETDHALSWLQPEDAMRQLSHESQQWAIATMLGNPAGIRYSPGRD
jgi:8-oxo-dGTP diphosphatase